MRSTSLFTGFLLASIRLAAHDHAHEGAQGRTEFHENKGQWPQQVLYRAMTPGAGIFLERDAFTYVLHDGGPKHGQPMSITDNPRREHAIRVRFEGGWARGHSATERFPHYANYFLGNDPANWAGRVSVFGSVELNDVYPGVDLHVRGASGLKYDWVIAPGADASAIRMSYEGHDGLEVRDGLVRVRTSAGELIEQRPVAWTVKHGGRVPVPCEFRLQGNVIMFSFPESYDRNSELVIDPVVVFGSYSGSTANNWGFTATYDDDGHLYAGSIAFSTGYPTTLGALQTSFGGNVIDMALSKFLPDGTSMVWSTYLGGSGNETPHSMVVNALGELYVLGATGSADFPTTVGAFDSALNTGFAPSFPVFPGYDFPSGSDVVVAHLSADATALIGSTYLGGSAPDGFNLSFALCFNYGDSFRGEIMLDAVQRPVIVTSTTSADMPVSAGAPQPATGGAQDAYACMFDPGLSTLLWGTYHGGSSDDAGYGVQQAGDGLLYITGGTNSSNMPNAGAPLQAALAGGIDGYIARYAADGSSLTATTYLGTQLYDQTYFVQVDLAGSIYVVGQTGGPYPVSSGVYQNAGSSQFIHKLDHDLATTEWSTRIGNGSGSEFISPSAFLVSDCGQIYFSGWGGTTNANGQADFSTTVGLPITPDAMQATTDGSDFYLMVLNADATSLEYATYYGGGLSPEHVDGGTSRFDKDGVVYQAVCAGCWNNSDFPTTPGAWSNTNDAGFNACNLGVFKIDFEQNVQVNIDASITATGACLTEPVVFTAVGTADEWSWNLGDGTLSTETTLAHLYDEPGIYTVMLIGTSVGLCVAVDTAYMEITVVAPAVMQPIFAAVPNGSCDAFIVELFNSSTGSSTYIWDFGDNTTSTLTNPVHSYSAPGDYTITLGVIDVVCLDTAYLSVDVPVEVPGITLDLVSPLVLCNGASVNINAGPGFDTYEWSTGEQAMIITVTEPGEYTVDVTDGFCVGADTVTVLGALSYPSLSDVELCPGEEELLVIPFDPDTSLWSDGSSGISLMVDAAGTYWYAALDPYGCPVTDTVLVSFATVATGEPFIPNVFTPNNDGKNERFLPTNVDATDYSMEIYNRWGMKMYGTVNSGVGWNGNRDNGSETVPDGTYFVILTYSAYCDNKDPVTITGHVTLLR